MALPSEAVMPGPAAEAEAEAEATAAAVEAAVDAHQQCHAASADFQEGCRSQESHPGSQRADLKGSQTKPWLR